MGRVRAHELLVDRVTVRDEDRPRLAEARQAFTLCLERFPRHAPALEYRARAARDAGDPRRAALVAQRAIQAARASGDWGMVLINRLIKRGQGVGDTRGLDDSLTR